VDAVMFCNEDDRPYTFHADFEAVAVMTRAITELHPTDRPFGVDFLWDAKAPMAMAKATGAAFIREVVTGVYESDMGLWTPDAAALYRYRRQIDAQGVRIFANITPEFALCFTEQVTCNFNLLRKGQVSESSKILSFIHCH